MKSPKRYLPVSLVLVLICSVSQASANSALDPYAHVKAPQGEKKKKTEIPSVDSITTPSTYVTMPMGDLDSSRKSGIVGSMLNSFGAPGKTIKKASGSMVSGTKAAGANLVKGSKMIGDGFAKSAGVIGQGIKSSGEKFMDGTQAVGSSIANAVPVKKSTPNQKSLEDLYIDKAKGELAKVDEKSVKTQLNQIAQDNRDKKSVTRKSFLNLVDKSNVDTSPAPASGFYEGAMAKQDQERQEEAVKELKQNAPQKPANQLAAQPLEKSKKKKWGLGGIHLNKPSIGAGLFKKKEQVAQKSEPQAQPAAVEANDLKAQPVAKAPEAPVPAQEEITTPKTTVAQVAASEDKKKRFGLSMPKLKLNPFSKKDQVQPQAQPNNLQL